MNFQDSRPCVGAMDVDEDDLDEILNLRQYDPSVVGRDDDKSKFEELSALENETYKFLKSGAFMANWIVLSLFAAIIQAVITEAYYDIILQVTWQTKYPDLVLENNDKIM